MLEKLKFQVPLSNYKNCSLDLIFFKFETYHLVFCLGSGVNFFRQLKLDILYTVGNAFNLFNCKKKYVFSTIAISAFTLV